MAHPFGLPILTSFICGQYSSNVDKVEYLVGTFPDTQFCFLKERSPACEIAAMVNDCL